MNCCEFFPCFLHLHITRMIFGGWSMNVILFFICTPFALNLKHTRSSCIYTLKAEFLKGKWRSWDRFVLFSIGNHPWLVSAITQGTQLALLCCGLVAVSTWRGICRANLPLRVLLWVCLGRWGWVSALGTNLGAAGIQGSLWSFMGNLNKSVYDAFYSYRQTIISGITRIAID